MPSHDRHTGDPRQVLFDGCRVCEARGKNIPEAIGSLDEATYPAAYARAADWLQGRLRGADISQAEKPLLRTLFAVQVQMQRRGFQVGSCPVEL